MWLIVSYILWILFWVVFFIGSVDEILRDFVVGRVLCKGFLKWNIILISNVIRLF